MAEQPSSGPWKAGQGQVERHIAENLANDSISRNFNYLTVGCLARLSIRGRSFPCLDNNSWSGSYCPLVTQAAPLLFHVLNDTDSKGWGTETSAAPRWL